MDYQRIIDKYYPTENKLKNILMVHSRAVADYALAVIARHPELNINASFVEEAAMLHDIGIFQCDVSGIECFGSNPYILHGRIGAELLRKESFPQHARVCERHTGAGITKEQIQENNLPLPLLDFCPESIEEKLVCYADKFFSKTKLDKTKTFDEALRSLKKFGEDGIERFCSWHEMFK